MESIALVKLNTSHLNELVSLSRQTFITAFGNQNEPKYLNPYLDQAFSLQVLKSELENPLIEYYFAQINDKSVGYLKLNQGFAQSDLKEEHALELERIYVLQNHQGKQIGQYMLDFFIQRAKELNKPSVWLGVWEKNLRAIEFYKRNGFKIVSSHAFNLGGDIQTDLIMKRSV